MQRLRLLSRLREAQVPSSSVKECLLSSLEEEGLVFEENGLVSIKADAGKVFSIELRRLAAGIAVSDLMGHILRYDRFPRAPGWEDQLSRTIEKMKGGDGKVYGIVIASLTGEDIPEFPVSPALVIPPSMAEARSEMARSKTLSSCLFLSWSDSFDASFLSDKGLIHLPQIGHIRVSREGKCRCGGTGCLNAVASVRYLKERTGERSTRALFKETPALRQALQATAFALSLAVQTLGAERIIITGGMSGMEDSSYVILNETLSLLLPPGRQHVKANRAAAGEKGLREGAAETALDAFFYHTDILSQLSLIESQTGKP